MTAVQIIDRLRARAGGLSLPAALRLPTRHVQVVQAVPVGPGARLLVVEFGGRRILVGQSRAGLSTLAETAAQ
jgi:flagellar protein FliO/FliZ